MDFKLKQQLDLANKLIFVQEYDKAEKIISALVESNESNAEDIVHLRYIELMNKLDKLENAKLYYLSKLAADNLDRKFTHRYKHCLLVIEQHTENVDHDFCILEFQKLIREYEETAFGYYSIGFSLENNADLDRAIYAYEQSISLAQDWYPSLFGLSQCYYQKGEDKKGDQFFYTFEKSAPYNVYGNFETHRRLCKDFIEDEEYDYAERAIKTLGDWWYENKSHCPPELQIYEALMVSHIYDLRGDVPQREAKLAYAKLIASQLLNDADTEEGILYFVARAMEEFSELETALEFYKKALKSSGADPQTVQRIGSQFLSMGESELALKLFNDAYESFPNSNEIKFCLLVSKLKIAGVNIEDYLLGKERLRQLITNQSDKVEILALLHSLLAKFENDYETHYHMADIYLNLQNINKAKYHFEKMHSLDALGHTTILRYATFIMEHGDADEAIRILKKLSYDTLSKEQKSEVNWLKSYHFSRIGKHSESQKLIEQVLQLDPWNVSYLTQEIYNLQSLLPNETEVFKNDSVIKKLSNHDEDNLDWADFDENTLKLEEWHNYHLIFSRWKLRYLYSQGNMDILLRLVASACQFDPEKATYDFLKLINTNFDSPEIYWALGTLYKELWQLETASVWFKQLLLHPDSGEQDKARAYLEIADCFVWRDTNLKMAVEYAKIASEMGEDNHARVQNILAHALLKKGSINEAREIIQTTKSTDIESIYLNGLLHYRDGAKNTANKIWKPLLTRQSECIRDHNIKQQLMGYYFDKKPYLNVQ